MKSLFTTYLNEACSSKNETISAPEARSNWARDSICQEGEAKTAIP